MKKVPKPKGKGDRVMSGKKSRNKGAAGEREFFRLVEEHLGVKLRRNLSQYQESGEGDAELAGFHLEIKRGKAYEKRWWKQAVQEANYGQPMALCFRLDRKQWRVKLAGSDFIAEIDGLWGYEEEATIEMGLEAFFQIVRERM